MLTIFCECWFPYPNSQFRTDLPYRILATSLIMSEIGPPSMRTSFVNGPQYECLNVSHRVSLMLEAQEQVGEHPLRRPQGRPRGNVGERTGPGGESTN